MISGYALFSLALGLLLAAGFERSLDAALSDRFGEPIFLAAGWAELDADPAYQEFVLSDEGMQVMYESTEGQAFLAAFGNEDFDGARRTLVAAPIWNEQQRARQTSREGMGQALLAAMGVFVVLSFASRFRPKSERDETES